MPSASTSQKPCEKYKYVVTAAGPMIVPVPDGYNKDEEHPGDYNQGGYLTVRVGDKFKDGRYIVRRKLGWGHFSTVWLVKDTLENRHSALKVVKSASRYAETAKDEILLLKRVMAADTTHPGREHVVSFLDAFQHRAPHKHTPSQDNDIRAGFMTAPTPAPTRDVHICIVCEPLGENLLSLLERNKKRGVSPEMVKVIAHQLLLGLQYLHDACGLVHTDIKPENIMISIPDVEAHIRSELSVSPTPTSRRVGVPLPTAKGRPGAAPGGAHRRANQSAHASARLAHQRQVEIFDSQPLSSPVTSAASSPATRVGLAMTRMKSGQGEKKGVPTVSVSSSVSTTPVFSMGATPGSAVVSAVSTPPTSLGSAFSKLTMSAAEAAASVSPDAKGKRKGSAESSPISRLSPLRLMQPKLSAAGPSLLSQTAPPDARLVATAEAPAVEHVASSSSDGSTSASNSSDSLSSLSTSLSNAIMHSEPLPTLAEVPTPDDTHSPTSPVPLPGPSFSHAVPTPPPISIKIADLGNATPATRHYTEDIQTRQYRAPEAIIGRSDWGFTADVWSAACVLFELLTAEYLFDPQGQGELFTKDDDHMAQIIELVGDFPLEVKMGGRFSRELFDSAGRLRYIKSLKPWPLDRVMVEKYLFTEEESAAFCDFMLPMLRPNHRERATAGDMVNHPWLET